MPYSPLESSFRQLRRWAFTLLLTGLTVSVVAVPRTALADPTEEEEEKGRDLARDAMTHYKEGEYQKALGLFDEARVIYPAGQVLRMTGYTLMALERWVEAADMLDQAIAATYKPMVPRDVEHAQDNLTEVLKHLIVVEVISDVPGAELSIDGGDAVAVPYKQRMLPGTHKLVVTAEEHEPIKKEITVPAGESVQYKLDPTLVQEAEPDPVPRPKPLEEPEPDSASSMFGWFPGQGFVGIAVGGVGLAAGIVGLGIGGYGTSLRSAVQDNISAHNTNYDASCSQNRDLCLSDIELVNRDGARAQDYQTAGLALGITGAALFAVGTTLFLFSDMSPLAPDEKERAAAGGLSGRCSLSLGGVGCAGTF